MRERERERDEREGEREKEERERESGRGKVNFCSGFLFLSFSFLLCLRLLGSGTVLIRQKRFSRHAPSFFNVFAPKLLVCLFDDGRRIQRLEFRRRLGRLRSTSITRISAPNGFRAFETEFRVINACFTRCSFSLARPPKERDCPKRTQYLFPDQGL